MAIVGNDPLVERSRRVLREGQARSGAFVASPSFRVYDFGWLRDGAFCAHALDRVGDHAAAHAFHAWAVSAIEALRPAAESAIARIRSGVLPPPEEMLPARFTLAGEREHADGDEPWPNFQVDGYGIWLWSLDAHVGEGGLPPDWRDTVELVASYVAATWRLRCWSCWEELQSGEHASTIGAACAGLAGAARLLGDERLAEESEAARRHLVHRFSVDGQLGREPGRPGVDGSMIWLAVPFGVLHADEPLAVATIGAVKRELLGPGGGVYRYRGDTYYGGGEWLLLTSSLAWYEAVTGGDGDELFAWVRAQAARNGDLPEQVAAHAQEPSMVEPWVRRWGPIANPLLWSHAMFLASESVR
jgi:GH15 family glucan-1,4-alpha-glucosidase